MLTNVVLHTCRTCLGNGINKLAGIRCVQCNGGGIEPIKFDLGPTRTYPKGRPAIYNPATGELSVTRGKKQTRYTIREFACQGVRGFAVHNLDNNETHHVKVGEPGEHTCDCGAGSYESTEKANQRALDKGEPIYPTWGCVHLDACLQLCWEGLFDLPKDKMSIHQEIAHGKAEVRA